MSTPQLVSIGYGGRDVTELIRSLKEQNVQVLVDVRLTPISRKQGLSKTALKAALAEAGISYVHHRELGNPKSNRTGYRQGNVESLARYQEILTSGEASSALRHVLELLDEEVVALLCFEKDHSQCHRSQVVDALCEQRNLSVVYA